ELEQNKTLESLLPIMKMAQNRFVRHEECLEYTRDSEGKSSQAGLKRRCWSSSLVGDVLAVAAPVVPTVLWAFSAWRGGTNPICNMGALLGGC
ncbi:hypothetical protein FK518_30970, partial [Klebsiella pneumoniae]|nr:hypothetical protein [Klebsiella pneumoniae]